MPPSIELARRIREGDLSAIVESREDALRALFENGVLEHFGFLDDVLTGKAQQEIVTQKGEVRVVGPDITQKLKALSLMMGGARPPRNAPNANATPGDRVLVGIVMLPAPDPVEATGEVLDTTPPRVLKAG